MFLIVVSLPFSITCVFINLTKYTFYLYVNTIYKNIRNKMISHFCETWLYVKNYCGIFV